MRGAGGPFLDACNCREVEYTPVWFMRQAGRYLPSYRKIKGERKVLELAKDPELASEVVVDAVKVLGVDAGIIFADIMLPLEPMGVKLEIQEDVGPIVSEPIRDSDGVNSLRRLDPEADLPYVFDGIEATLAKLDARIPLIGFSGAPFTLAAYLVEGGPSRDLEITKSLMYAKPEVWHALMTSLTDMVKVYLRGQIRHGVSTIQLFDSWAGSLSPEDYLQSVFPFTKEIFESVRSTPRIHFCADSAALLESFARTGANVLSVDWRMPISDVWSRCGEFIGAQGNLDPVLAMAGGAEMERRVARILDLARGHRGHIFSLGHGVLRTTDPENLRRVVRLVHDKTKKRR